MKRFGILVTIVLLLTGFLASAEQLENLYELVVPDEFSSLSVSGGLSGDNAVEIDIDFAPFGFEIDLGGDLRYSYNRQSLNDSISITGFGNIQIGTGSTGFDVTGSGDYKSYTLDFGEMTGFYSAGGSARLNPRVSAGTTTLWLWPYGGIGIGRSFSIRTIKEIELIMKYLDISPTVEQVRAAAEIMYTRGIRINRYSTDNSQNYIDYIRDLAQALGAPDKVLEILYIGNSQEYAFELARYNNFRYGWEVEARLRPLFWISPSFAFSTDIIIDGDYADFAMDNMLYYLVSGSMTLSYNPKALTKVTYRSSVTGSVSYLPDDPRWWATGGATVSFGTTDTPKVNVSLNGELYYLINPNFTTYAGVSVTDNLTDHFLYAGGVYRIW